MGNESFDFGKHLGSGDYLETWARPGIGKDMDLQHPENKALKDKVNAIFWTRIGAAIASVGISEAVIGLFCAGAQLSRWFKTLSKPSETSTELKSNGLHEKTRAGNESQGPQSVKQKRKLPEIQEPEVQTYEKGEKKAEVATGQKKGDGKLLGAGNYGEAWTAKADSKKVIKKPLSNDSATKEELVKEAKIGMHLNHPCLMKVHGIWEKKYSDPAMNKMKLEIEFCKGKPLAQINVNSGPAEGYKRGLKEAGNCLLYLFEQGVQWGDLSENNVIIDSNYNFKFIDFGRYQIQHDDKTRAIALLREYTMLLSKLYNHITPLALDAYFNDLMEKVNGLVNKLQNGEITPEMAMEQFRQLNQGL